MGVGALSSFIEGPRSLESLLAKERSVGRSRVCREAGTAENESSFHRGLVAVDRHKNVYLCGRQLPFFFSLSFGAIF